MIRRTWTLLLGISLIAPLWSTAPLRADAPPVEVLPQSTIPTESGPPVVLDTKPLNQITTDVRPPAGAMPDDAAARLFDSEPILQGSRERGFGNTVFFWEASNLMHRPLYFEQAYVERYGYNYRVLQPVVSGVEFYTDVAFLPFKAVGNIHRPYVYALGPARPGARGVPNPRW